MNLAPNYFNVPYWANNGIIWVNGIEGAKAFQMMQGSEAILLDSETEGVMYIKTVDSIGMANVRTFHFEETTPKSEYITRKEFDELISLLKGERYAEQPIQSVKPENNRTGNPKRNKTEPTSNADD